MKKVPSTARIRRRRYPSPPCLATRKPAFKSPQKIKEKMGIVFVWEREEMGKLVKIVLGLPFLNSFADMKARLMKVISSNNSSYAVVAHLTSISNTHAPMRSDEQ